ncbi:MAG: deoxynucleoside kinase [Oscillospiraceae bacterium]|nr:deoxynucleoside kinase [Oscillospiraceae bacterium]
MSGKLIVIEGLDGSGKATQSELLFDALRREGKRVRKLSFPDYGSLSSGPVRMYLNGEFGKHPDDVDSYAASVLYAVDRFANFRSQWKDEYDRGTVFVCDRYTTSNEVFQTCKLPEEKWDEYLSWLEDFEYRLMGIPRPSLVLFLNMSEECSKKLLEKRYGGDESKKDIHERDEEYQKRCRKAALYCADNLGWEKIDCDRGGELMSIDEIHNKIMHTIARVPEI